MPAMATEVCVLPLHCPAVACTFGSQKMGDKITKNNFSDVP